MKPDLPDILDRYFKAQNAHDISAMVACFDSDASVHDEGRHIVIVKVSGAFDGSPANLTYSFGLSDDGRISALEVR
jgi:hypothetical protein